MKKRFCNVCLIILAVVFYTLLILHTNRGLICPFHAITGWNCGFCGTTRSVLCMLHGNFSKAFSYNHLTMPLIIPGTCMLLFTAFQYIKGISFENLTLVKILYRFRWILIIIFLGFTVIRNIIE